jgi:hypothetical protein
MVCIRQATVDDLISVQNTNLWCLRTSFTVRVARRTIRHVWLVWQRPVQRPATH